ncbi:M16 family metallopeptidase [Uliginosibacterium sediminicola]|uniref:Insulinase family protein n=1 Tax=Uliginosibacterium sediminicola TaxID=2024550 RepID=A0ABU9YYV9_9RHOO
MFSLQNALRGVIRLFLYALLGSAALAQAAEPFDWDPRVVRGQLSNGLSYYIVAGDKLAGPRVAMQLLVRVGSLDEREDQSGVAHMVEHMVFHASARHPEGLSKYMESLGWRIGTHYNAQTNFERTLYMLSPENRPERIDAALDVLSQMGGAAQIPAAGLQSERKVILEEWRTKLGLRARMDQQRRALLRAGSLYPERPTIGSEASIRTQTAESLQAFYRDWYRPNNMALIIVGDVDAAAIQQRIETYFSSLQAAPLPARNPPDPQLQDSLRIARMQDAESGSSQVGWVFRFVTDNRQDSEGLRQRMIDRIAERAVRRLAQRQAKDLPAGVESLSSSKGLLGKTVESLGFAATVAVDGHAAGLQQILLLQERLRRDGVREQDVRQEIEELQRLNEKALSQHAARDQSSWLQILSEAVQDERVLQAPVQKQAQIRQIIAGLSLADINARVRQWLSAPDRLLFMLAPGLSPLQLPDQASVLAAQQALRTRSLPALADSPAAETLAEVSLPEASLPEAGPTAAVLQEEDLGQGVLRWTLPNGDKLVWDARPAGAPLRFVARSAAGFRLPGAPAWQWQMAAQLGAQADLPGQAAGTLARWATRQTLQLNQSQDDRGLVYNAQTKAELLEPLLQLYVARQQSSLSAAAVQAARQQLARQLARQTDSSSDRMARELSRLRFGPTPQDAAPDAAALARLDTPAGLDALREKWQLLTAQPTTFFLSGPNDVATVRRLVERYLATLPRTATPLASQPLLQAAGARSARLEISPEPQASVRAFGSQSLNWSPERAMAASVLARVIQRSLRAELREKESGIYRLSFSLSLEPHSGRLASELFFTTAPERVDALWAIAHGVLAKLPEQLDTRLLAEEVEHARSAERARQGDESTRFQRLQLSYAQYGDARYLQSSTQLASTLSVDSVRALAAELALTRDLVLVQMLPRAAGGEAAR